MNWVIATGGTILSMVCLAAAATMAAFQSPPPVMETGPINFNLLDDTPVVMANLDSLPSFELVAMTEPHSPAPSTIRARQKGPVAAPKPQTEVLASKERSRRVLYFTGPSCGHCQAWDQTTKQDLLKAGWQIDSTPNAHVQVVDASANPALASALGVSALPTFVRQVDGRAEATHIGPISAWGLAEFYRPSR